MGYPAKFITFEGGEGCGKTTQMALLSAAFSSAGIPHITSREPGGVPIAEKLRELLVKNNDDNGSVTADVELLLFQAARLSHIGKLIKPALTAGKWVLCDRFVDSSRIYQGIGKNLGTEYIDRLYSFTAGNFFPDITLLLDVSPQEGLSRAAARRDNENRFEQLDLRFHQKVRDGFLMLASKEPQRFIVIDANAGIDKIHRQIVEQLNLRLNLSLPLQKVG